MAISVCQAPSKLLELTDAELDAIGGGDKGGNPNAHSIANHTGDVVSIANTGVLVFVLEPKSKLKL